MKTIFALTILLTGLNVFATTPVVLQCDGQRNLIYDSVRSITLNGSNLMLVEETDRGAYVSHNGILFQPNSGFGTVFKVEDGVEVTIPYGLLNGTTDKDTVRLATYDYPYETTECSVLK